MLKWLYRLLKQKFKEESEHDLKVLDPKNIPVILIDTTIEYICHIDNYKDAIYYNRISRQSKSTLSFLNALKENLDEVTEVRIGKEQHQIFLKTSRTIHLDVIENIYGASFIGTTTTSPITGSTIKVSGSDKIYNVYNIDKLNHERCIFVTDYDGMTTEEAKRQAIKPALEYMLRFLEDSECFRWDCDITGVVTYTKLKNKTGEEIRENIISNIEESSQAKVKIIDEIDSAYKDIKVKLEDIQSKLNALGCKDMYGKDI